MMMQTAPPEYPEPLFGRDREIQTLRAVVDDARHGRGKLVLVSGEAGIGKTSLIEHVVDAEAQDALVLTAACRDLTTSPPFGIWSDIFSAYQRLADDDFPPAPVVDGDLGQAGTRGELFADILNFLARLSEQLSSPGDSDIAARRPTLIVLEDLHWSDDASLELLHHLAINIEHLPVVFLGSYRDIEVTSGVPLYGRLPRLVRDSRATRLELRHIGVGAIDMLVAARYPMEAAADRQQLAAWLYSHGEGIPFFTVELLFNLEADGKLRRQGDRWRLHDLGTVRVPLLVRQFVDQRLERLTPEQAQILQLAAVIGDEIPLDLWSTLAGVDDLDLIDVIEASLQIGILHELPTLDGYRFAHALFRATLYNQLILPRRRAWHGRLGEILIAGQRPDPDIVAHHFQLAGDPRAGHWLIEAGRRAVKSFAYAMAAERFEQALSLLDQNELPASDQGWLLCDLAMTFRFADASRGLGYIDRAIHLAEDLGDEALGLYSRWCHSQIRSLRGDNALDEVNEVAAALDDRGEYPGIQRALVGPNGGSVAQAFARYGDYDRALEIAQSYLDQHPNELSADIGRAYSAIGLASAGKGDISGARRAFSQGRNAASQLRDSHLTGMLLNWELMEVVLPYDADQREARRQLAADAIAAWDRVEMPGSAGRADDESRPSTDMSVYATLLLDGAWDTAEEQARIDLEFDGMRFDALRVLCILATRRGQFSEARRYLQQALPQGASTEPSNYYFLSTLWLQRTAAELAIATGDLAMALRWADAHDAWVGWSGRTLNRAENRVIRGMIHEARGDLALAERCATEALELASDPHQPLALIEAERYLGHLALERD
ncbi:MAG: AAA family ATPase, partial [Thermomicrobiales bacterium]